MSYTRQLTFKSENLGTFASLVLIFDKSVDGDGLFTTKFPVVLQSSEFQSDGVSMTSFTYQNQPAFLKPSPLVNETIASLTAYQALNLAQETTLLVDEKGSYSFTNPAAGLAGNVTAVNGTSNNDDIAFGYGYLDPSREPRPVYYWTPDAFKASSNVEANLRPVLRAYVVNGYQDGQVIKAPFPVPVLFEEDLSALPNRSVWILTYDKAAGNFTITREA